MGLLKYSSNNSGGSFWLSLADWQALEKGGWIVHWVHDEDDPSHTHEGDHSYSFGVHMHDYSDELVPAKWNGQDWLGTPAKGAVLVTDDPQAGVDQFEALTGQNLDDEGCNCCGPPHSISFQTDDGKTSYLSSRPSGYSRSWSEW